MTSITNAQRARLLYKTILRLHQGLPPDLNELGSKYARDEFQRHKNCNPKEAEVFLNEWSSYAFSLAEQLKLKSPECEVLGVPLSESDLDHFNSNQIHQLYELMQATKQKKDESDDHR